MATLHWLKFGDFTVVFNGFNFNLYVVTKEQPRYCTLRHIVVLPCGAWPLGSATFRDALSRWQVTMDEGSSSLSDQKVNADINQYSVSQQ